MTDYHSIRDEVVATLEAIAPLLRERFGICQLRLFGSVSRGTDTRESDIDLLYIFSPEHATYDNLYDLHEYLTELFGRKIELVSETWSGKRFLQSALHDAVDICVTAGATEQGIA